MSTFDLPPSVTGAARSYLERAKIVLERMSYLGQSAYFNDRLTLGPIQNCGATYAKEDNDIILSTLRQWRDEVDARRAA